MNPLTRAAELFDQGKYRDAIGEYTRALERKPTPGAYNDRGSAYYRLELYEEAAADYRRAIELRPRYGWAKLNLAQTLEALKHPEEARRAYEEAARLDPAQELRALAAIGRDVGEIQKCVDEAEAAADAAAALAAYDRAIGLDGSLPSLYLGRAMVQERLQNLEAAIADLDRAIGLHPDYARAYLERGRFRGTQGGKRAALEDETRSLELDPYVPTAHNNRAASWITLNEYERALADCDRALELQPHFPLAWFNRGIAQQELGRFEEALAAYRESIRQEPARFAGLESRMDTCEFELSKRGASEEAHAHYQKSNEHIEAGLFQKADEAMTQAIDRAPDVPMYWVQRGYIRGRLNDLEASVTDYRQGIKGWPGYLLAHRNIAEASLTLKKHEEARAAAEAGLAVFALHPRLLEPLARARQGLGDLEGAIEATTQAMRAWPEWAKPYWVRACARWERQDYRGVIEDMERAVELDSVYENDARPWIEKARAHLGGGGTTTAAPRETATSPYQVQTHGGDVNQAHHDFFFPPPKEIGGLLSAQTTLGKGVEPTSVGRRLLLMGIGMGVGAAVGGGIDWIFEIEDGFWLWAWPIGLAGLGLLFLWLGTGFDHTSSYVGTDGIARYRCGKRRDKIVDWNVMRFADARELRTSQTRRFLNGVYQGTDYRYWWTNAEGRTVWTSSGTYQGKDSLPVSTDFYHFCLAAENAWSAYLMDRAEEALRQHGFLHFSIRGSDYIRVAPGWVEVSIGGKSDRREAAEIASVSLSSGKFTLSMRDAKRGFFRSSGIFEFEYGQMANVNLFMLALEKLAGIEVV